ncbi:MAG: cytochrome c-type biogenesis protein CcmH [Chloroflexi bacterium]|nr:cytochrome c-type biogenesis protein CcmH [Chloroflexota bacterium]
MFRILALIRLLAPIHSLTLIVAGPIRSLALIVAGLALFIFPTVALADTTQVDAISNELMCQCGCTMVVTSCECSTAAQMREVIQTQLGEGKTKTDILQYFVGQYGEAVLSAPTKEGFNLTAWITPFVGILAGLGLVYLILRAWLHHRRQVVQEVLPRFQADLNVYNDRIERELELYS